MHKLDVNSRDCIFASVEALAIRMICENIELELHLYTILGLWNTSYILQSLGV